MILLPIILSIFGTEASEISSRIFGGSFAEKGQFPFMVSVQNKDKKHICSGTLIADKSVLKVAHCTLNNITNVVAGITNLDGTTGVTSEISNMIIHRNFNPIFRENDIALLRLSKTIEQSNDVKYIQLENDFNDDVRNIQTIGWGITNIPGRLSKKLKYVQAHTLPMRECINDDIWKILGVGGRHLGSAEICTVSKMGEGACNGDSGDPSVVNNGSFVIVGVMSARNVCDDGLAQVSMRVSSFYAWIQAEMRN